MVDLSTSILRRHSDSFMVTTTSAADALAFALGLQQALYEYDWDWDECDEFYREATLTFVPVESLTASEDDYRTQAGVVLRACQCCFLYAYR